MSDEDDGTVSDTDDLGEPIAQLEGFAITPGARFIARVERGLERRHLASELVGLSVLAPMTIFLSLLRIPFDWIDERRAQVPPPER
ncbi:MAG: hypothetical protein MUF00_13035 [Gemmatimonadaceae bacterium]|jgi:hypothetical protein|nr:hypothetical protein [Gemmatimonadaceae bacterium]